MKRFFVFTIPYSFLAVAKNRMRPSGLNSGFMGLAIMVCLAMLPQNAGGATTFQSVLTNGTTFNIPGVPGVEIHLDGNPACTIRQGDHSYAGEPFVTQGAGNHDIKTTAATGGIDTFIALYSPSFDPNDPTANLITCDDDGGAPWPLSKITSNLTAGTQYEVVVTTWNNVPGNGTIDWEIEPDIVLGVLPADVPTLSEWGMIIFAAVLGILAVRRIRRQPGAAA